MNMLSKQQLDQYHRDGIAFPVEVFSPDEASVFRHDLQSVARTCEGGLARRLDSLHLFFPWAYRLATHDPLLNAVESILGADILIDGTLVFYKPPHDSSFVSWHQDSVYSGWHLTPSTSAWIALTASHQVNGCMRVIRGSHMQGLLNHENAKDDSNLLRRGERVAGCVDESAAVDVVLQPGEMSLHHSNIVHGSNPNKSEGPRIGFIVRFVTDRIENRGRPVLRARGHADCSHLTLADPPSDVSQEAALSAWRSFCSRSG